MRSICRTILRCVTLRLLRVETHYSQETLLAFQNENRVIVCCNHVSLIDGIIVALSSPIPLTFGVDTDFSRKSKFARTGLAALSWLGFGRVIPIDSNSPYGIRCLVKALANGESVMLFPEGKISETGAINQDQPGLTWLIKRTQVHVLRIEIRGAERSFWFAKNGDCIWPRIEVRY